VPVEFPEGKIPLTDGKSGNVRAGGTISAIPGIRCFKPRQQRCGLMGQSLLKVDTPLSRMVGDSCFTGGTCLAANAKLRDFGFRWHED